jgi:thiol-disulfide isomerase/thioredoxin
MRGIVFVAFMGFAWNSFGAMPKLGELPPEIVFDELLPSQPVAAASFKALTGKPIILEMWATWCGSCIAAIPHLNELAKKFHDSVVFISVTDEDSSAVGLFLKTILWRDGLASRILTVPWGFTEWMPFPQLS